MAVVRPVLILIVLILLLPYLCGLTVRREEDKALLTWGKGYLVSLALACPVLFICILLKTTLVTAMIVWLSLVAVWIIAFLIKSGYSTVLAPFRTEDEEGPGHVIAKTLFVVLVLIQAIIPVLMLHDDQDDATYVGMASTAVETNTLMEFHPYTGYPLPADKKSGLEKYVVAPLFGYYAMLSASSGLRPVVLCHSVIPFFLTIISYIFYYALGTLLFRERERADVFALLAAVIQICSYMSYNGLNYYNSGSFSLVRIWQGKGQFCAIVIPALLYAFFVLFRNQDIRKKDYLFLASVLAAAAVMTPIGNLLALIMTAFLALVIAVARKKPAVIAGTAACALIPAALIAYYIVIQYIV